MVKNIKFEKLLEPGRIGSLKIKNRMVKSGAAARYWGKGMDQINDTSKYYYEAFAAVAVAGVIASLIQGELLITSIIILVVVLGILFWVLHIGDENKGWPQLK